MTVRGLPDELLDWFGDEFDRIGGADADPDELRALMVLTDARRRRWPGTMT